MAKGMITQLTGKAGKILGDDGKYYKFNKKAMAEGKIRDAQRGQRVTFNRDGNRADNVRLLDEVVDPAQATVSAPASTVQKPSSRGQRSKSRQRSAPTRSETRQSSNYYFLNPYNFVRPIDQERPENTVVGNCSPSPHDRYVGLTGCITVHVTAKTPLFISDSHATDNLDLGNKKTHTTYRFFEYDGQPALPASSLRGMLRSTFETVTNSCFGSFSNFGQLEYRAETNYARRLTAGIVQSLPSNDQDGKIALCRDAKIGAYYTDEKRNRNLLADSNWQCGDYVWARVTKGRNARVWQLAKSRDEISETTRKSETVSGYLKITGQNIENKNNEFLFLDPEKHGGLGTVSFTSSLMADYNTVLKGQIEEQRLEGSLYQNKKLTAGDLVWVEKKGGQAVNIVRVKIPRLRYEKPVERFLQQIFHPCTDYNTLCPACRTFGWVHKNAADLSQDKEVAYAGRIRLSHATPVGDTVRQRNDAVTLAILGSPKPTQTNFYLLNKNGQPDSGVDYNKDTAQLRGRKFYRHHGDEPSKHRNGYEYERVTNAENNGKDDQNRTVRGVVEPDSQFEFTLDFENLAPLELGALLWALELEEGMFHRLGYAKPLGFGSIKQNVTKLEWVNWLQRLESLDVDAGWQEATGRKENLKQEFTQAMRKHYGDDFDRLLAELRAILSQHSDGLPVHYPRKGETPSIEGKNFEWFTDKKMSNETLALATNDEGLPLP